MPNMAQLMDGQENDTSDFGSIDLVCGYRCHFDVQEEQGGRDDPEYRPIR